MNRHEFAHSPCGGGTGVGGGLHGTDITPHEHGDVSSPDIFLPHQHDVRAFHHRVRRFNGSDETLGLHHAERICCHCCSGRTGGFAAGTLTRIAGYHAGTMSRIQLCSWLLLAAAGLGVSCSGAGDGAVAVATPSLVMGDAAAIGSPIEMTYQFAVAADAPAFGEDYGVFVHFLDADGELMWADDHDPPTPTSQWTPGLTVEYPRTLFIPRFPYVGLTRVAIGLVSPTTGERLPLAGDTNGERSYEIATFDLRLASENRLVVYADGWHNVETSGAGQGLEWRWSMQEATLSFSNPERDVRFYLQLDQPVAALAEPQQVEVRAGTEVVDRFVLPLAAMELRRVDIPASALGGAATVDLTISVDRSFVPASVPGLESADPRELGVRVFRAFVQPL